MLVELSISNFALIDTLQLQLGSHFNVFTGETGAGKSILLDAVSALVGERTGADVVRAGAERAVIEGVFDIAALLETSASEAMDAVDGAAARSDGADEGAGADDGQATTLTELLAELGIEPEDGQLILAREVARSGRGIARVNGRAVPLSTLQRLAAVLVDIHGQSAHLTLLRSERHLFYLDRYANLDELRGKVGELVAQWRAVRRELSGCGATSAKSSGVSSCCATRWMRSRDRGCGPANWASWSASANAWRTPSGCKSWRRQYMRRSRGMTTRRRARWTVWRPRSGA